MISWFSALTIRYLDSTATPNSRRGAPGVVGSRLYIGANDTRMCSRSASSPATSRHWLRVSQWTSTS